MRIARISMVIVCIVGLAACSNDEGPSRPFVPENPLTRSDGVLMPLAVGNEWVYLSHSADGICGTLWDDSAKVLATTLINGDVWFEVYFTYVGDTLLLRNTSHGLEINENDSIRLVAAYPATERVTFLSYSPFRIWKEHKWLMSDAYPVYDTLTIGYEDEAKLLCVTYNGYVPNDDSTAYIESYAPDVGLVRVEHSGKNDMFHFTYGTYLRSYTLH